MIIDDVMAMNIVIIYKSCTLQRSACRNITVSRLKQRTVRSNYVYRTVKTCKSLKRDVHEQMFCGYNYSTISTYPSTAFAANRLKMVRRRCKTSYASSYRTVRCFDLLTAIFLQAQRCKVQNLYIIIIFMAITSSIIIPQPSRNAWALNEMAYRLCARPFLPTDDVSL